MLVKKTSAALDVNTNVAKETGWLFFNGGVIVILGVPNYTLLERWRRKPFRPNEQSDNYYNKYR